MRIANPTAKRGEDIACDYLQKKGYKIVERNFRKRYGEIDIIAVKSGILIFIEVKTRKSSQYGSPLESITSRKLHVITKTALFYKSIHQKLPDMLRIDAVSIELSHDEGVRKIEHVENITGF